MKLRRLQQRLAVATIVVAGHLVLLALLRQQKPALMAGSPSIQVALLGRVPSGSDLPPIRTLKTVDHPITPQPPQSLPLETSKPAVDVTPQSLSLTGFLPAGPSPWVPTPASQPMGATAAEAPAGNSGSGGADCKLDERVQSALAQDPRVRAALALVPSRSRSVANAIALWNGGWIDAESLGGPAALEPLRGAIVDTVLAAPAACQSRPVLGPRFIFVPEDGRATVLAFGSGVWTWSDLLNQENRHAPGH